LKDGFLENLRKAEKQCYRYTCLIMERMEGITRLDLEKEYGDIEGKKLLKAACSDLYTQLALGEAYVIDLVMGNYDRLWGTIHEGNVMFSLAMERDDQGKARLTKKGAKPISLIDQTISTYGQFISKRRYIFKLLQKF